MVGNNENTPSLSMEVSDSVVIHQEILDKVNELLPMDEELYDLAEFFKVFADSTRIKILHALSISEMCVYDLAAILGVTQSAVSHQLRTLKQMRLVKFRREGKIIYYSLADTHIELILKQGFEHINE